MVGVERALPPAFVGVLYGRKIEENFGEQEMKQSVVLNELGHFSRLTEWQKDVWSDNRGYPKALTDLMDAASVIHDGSSGLSGA